VSANGIDVSNNNGKLNLGFDMIGLDFAIAKCTESTSFADSTYNHYQTQARQLGVHFGAYHYLHAENLDGKAEAEWFLRHAALKSGNSVWIDYETYGTNGHLDLAQVAAFALTVKACSPVPRVGLYANLTGYARLGHLGLEDVCEPLWLAYPTGQAETPDYPLAQYGLTWTLHQYEVFAGIDRDYSRVAASELTSLFTWPK
jgi:lysozyme